MLRKLLLTILTAALLVPALAAAVHVEHRDNKDTCETAQPYSRIASMRSGSTTIQLAGTTTSATVPMQQAIVFSLDGGFWIDFEYNCVEYAEFAVTKDGALYWFDAVMPRCGSGAISVWVEMGVEVSEVSASTFFVGCDGMEGGDRTDGRAGDPPLFTRDGELSPRV